MQSYFGLSHLLQLEDRFAEKALGHVLVDNKMFVSQKYSLAAKKSNNLVSCFRQSIVNRLREGGDLSLERCIWCSRSNATLPSTGKNMDMCCSKSNEVQDD